MDDISDAGCGDVKGCYRFPEKCSQPDSCDYFVSWTPNGDQVDFELSVTKAEADEYWTALGISRDNQMVYLKLLHDYLWS